MKKVITIAICVCLVFSSITPAYAANNAVYEFMDSVSGQGGRIGAYTAINTIISYLAILTNHSTLNQQFLTLDGDGNNPATYYSFQDVAQDIRNIAVDVTLSTSSGAYTIKELLELINYSNSLIDGNTSIIATSTQSINSGLMSYRNSILTPRLNSFKTYLEKGLLNAPAFYDGRDNNTNNPYIYALTIDPQSGYGHYSLMKKTYTGNDTSKLDFVIALLDTIAANQAYDNEQMMYDVDSTLSIWDSQGDSLTQSTWTPTSGFNGLYKYLAYTQRDVARLTHVLASDYEIEARDNVQDLQETFNDEFLDPSSDGAISTNDVEDISGLSGGIKENISTNANASGIFDIFNSNHGGWFSQETANELDTSTPQNRGDRNADTAYPTPLLDERINEIYNALGVNNND